MISDWISKGVKAINRVPSIKTKLKDTGKSNSPIKSRLKDTGKSNSPKSRWVPMSEMVFSPQPVTQYNPITGEVRKESEKSAVDDNPKVSKVSDESNMSAVVASVIYNVPVATKTDKKTEPVVAAVESVVEKHNPKVTSKVSDESVKVPVVKKSVKASSVVTDKMSSENQEKIDLVADKRSSIVAEKVDVVVKKSVKASSVVANKFDVVKDKVDVVVDKASDALKNKLTMKGKKPVVEIIVLRLSKQEENPEVKAKVNVKRKMILSKEDDRKKKLKADRKRQKLKIKAGLKRNGSGSDSSDSSEIDTKSIKLLISKLEKKVKKQEYDEDSVPKKIKKKLSKKVEKEVSDEESLPKKGNKKLTKKVKKEESDEDSIPKKGKKKKKQLTPKEAAHEEYLLSFPSFHARTAPSSLFSAIKNSRVDILRFLTDIGFSSLHNISIDHLPSKLGWFAVSKFKSYMLIYDSGDKIEVTPSKIHDMLGVPFKEYSLFDLDERETDHEFVRKWAGQFYPLELKKVRVNDIAQKLIAAQEIDILFKVNFLTLYTNTMDWEFFLRDINRRLDFRFGREHFVSGIDFGDELELKDHVVGLLDLHDEWNEAEDLIKKAEEKLSLICAERVILEDYMRKASLKCHGDGKFVALHEKYDLIKKAEEKLSLICAERVILEDYMRKASLKCHGDGKFVALHEKYVNLFKDPISFEDDGNGDNVGDDDDENGDDDENRDDDGGNVNNDVNDCDVNRDSEDVNKCDKDPNGSNPSFGFSKIGLEDFGNDSGPTEKDKTVKGTPTEQGTVVEGNEAEEWEIMCTPENFTQWLEKNVDLVGEVIDSITAKYLYGDLFGDNSATLESMNQEITPEKLPTQKGSHSPKKELVILSKSHEIHYESHVIYFESHIIHSKSHMIHSETHVIHSESHVIQIICHMRFIDSESHVFFPIFKSEHLYMVVFSLTKTTAMTILDNSPGTYDSKYKEVCDLLKNLFARHLKQYGHIWHAQLQRDMLRRLRFKFATKILSHEINVHAGKMLELAKEFDKTDPVEKMAIIVDAFKKREERECI
nr:hypothetical protein [Tanacetum cinerariifolium]